MLMLNLTAGEPKKIVNSASTNNKATTSACSQPLCIMLTSIFSTALFSRMKNKSYKPVFIKNHQPKLSLRHVAFSDTPVR